MPISIPINHKAVYGSPIKITIESSNCTTPVNKATQNICLNPFTVTAVENELILSSKKYNAAAIVKSNVLNKGWKTKYKPIIKSNTPDITDKKGDYISFLAITEFIILYNPIKDNPILKRKANITVIDCDKYTITNPIKIKKIPSDRRISPDFFITFNIYNLHFLNYYEKIHEYIHQPLSLAQFYNVIFIMFRYIFCRRRKYA